MTALRKGANDTWTIVQPVERRLIATASAMSSRISRTSKKQRVVDENAADLKAYGLAEPRIEVTFHVDGEKEPKRILLGDKTPASSGTLRQASDRATACSSSNRRSRRPSTSRPSISATRRRSRSTRTKVDVARARVGAQTIRLEKSGRGLEAGEAGSGARGFRQRERRDRTTAVGPDDGAEGSS